MTSKALVGRKGGGKWQRKSRALAMGRQKRAILTNCLPTHVGALPIVILKLIGFVQNFPCFAFTLETRFSRIPRECSRRQDFRHLSSGREKTPL